MSELVAGRIERHTSWTTDGLVAVGAAGLASVGWATARMGGVDLAVRSGSGTSNVSLASVVVVALVAGIAGAMLLRLLERRTASGLRVWTIVAAAVWALSLSGPLSARSLAAGGVLAALHLLVGGVVVLGLRHAHTTHGNK
jgi:Family of unknown function (DUF6069)